MQLHTQRHRDRGDERRPTSHRSPADDGSDRSGVKFDVSGFFVAVTSAGFDCGLASAERDRQPFSESDRHAVRLRFRHVSGHGRLISVPDHHHRQTAVTDVLRVVKLFHVFLLSELTAGHIS